MHVHINSLFVCASYVTKFLQTQSAPLLIVPSGHSQVKLPSRLLHSIVEGHGPDKHSSISMNKMYSSKQLIIIIIIMYIPLQLLPFSSNSYPLLHEHVKEPSALVHSWSQGSSLHSSMSKIQ